MKYEEFLLTLSKEKKILAHFSNFADWVLEFGEQGRTGTKKAREEINFYLAT